MCLEKEMLKFSQNWPPPFYNQLPMFACHGNDWDLRPQKLTVTWTFRVTFHVLLPRNYTKASLQRTVFRYSPSWIGNLPLLSLPGSLVMEHMIVKSPAITTLTNFESLWTSVRRLDSLRPAEVLYVGKQEETSIIRATYNRMAHDATYCMTAKP